MTVFGVHVGLQHTTADELRDVWRKVEDLGFGWNLRESLWLDRAELLDAFRELAPLYRILRAVH